MNSFRRAMLAACGWIVAVNVSFGANPATNIIDFDRVIQPLLADKCFRCHGPDEAAREADLRLDLRKAAVSDVGDDGSAIIAFDAKSSEVIRRITSDDPDTRMPPPDSKLSLSQSQTDNLIRWIDQGAVYSQHWSFRPIKRPPIPIVRQDRWPRNAIDRFILARLEAEPLRPSKPADRYRLVRRVSLDLTGLPPTPGQADAFARDRSPQAYERLVDRLLSSPAFGERMAWNWLDAARYADSNGYQGDQDRTMWPWRDWVVRAINENVAFDQLTIQQLAGDLLSTASHQDRLATGFCRNHMINGEGGRIPEENRVDYVMDMTETMGTVWLGLTLNCCRCHDHKFDPLSRRDYYSLFAFFNQTPVDGSGGNPQTPPTLTAPTRAQQRLLASLESRISKLQREVSQLESQESVLAGVPPAEETSKLLAKPVDERSAADLAKLGRLANESTVYAKRLDELRVALEGRSGVLASIPRVMVMDDLKDARATFMLDKGLYNQPQDEVTAAVPQQLPRLSPDDNADRLGLARWIVAENNPLTARVIVNRIWQDVFGLGVVKTPEDFGTQGERPTHPQLLDWLASELRDSGWDTKHIYRLIVTSATYQQSSRSNAQLRERDPENRLFARSARYRLPSWMIRDQALFVSGLLVDRVGGPPVNSYQPTGVWEEATFGNRSYRRDSGAKLYRRSIYTFWRRIVAPTLFFDTASRQVCTVKHSLTNSPLHALTTLNDVTYIEAARVLATRIIDDAPHASDDQWARRAFREVLIRPPQPGELQILTTSLSRLRQRYANEHDLAAELIAVGEYPVKAPHDPPALAALTSLCNTIMNLDEALCKE